MKKQLAVLGIALACGWQLPAQAAMINGTMSFDGTESTMSPRFFRPGSPTTTCSEFGGGGYQYKTVNFTSDATGQLTAAFDPGTCGTNVYVTFHERPFNNADICQGFVWSYGSSVAYTGEAVTVTPNTPMVMVVSGVQSAPGVVCSGMSYALDGVGSGATAIPTLSEWGVAILSGLLALGTVITLRRRRA